MFANERSVVDGVSANGSYPGNPIAPPLNSPTGDQKRSDVAASFAVPQVANASPATRSASLQVAPEPFGVPPGPAFLPASLPLPLSWDASSIAPSAKATPAAAAILPAWPVGRAMMHPLAAQASNFSAVMSSAQRSAPPLGHQNQTRSHQPFPPALPRASNDVSTSAAPTPGNDRQFFPAAQTFGSDSTTRLIRDQNGQVAAIIRACRPSEGLVRNDANPDSLRSGSRYAQVNRAITNVQIIDQTTDMLLDILQQSILAMGLRSGALFETTSRGVRKESRELGASGIGKDGVEQSFKLTDWKDIQCGLDGTIRTDVVLGSQRSLSAPYRCI